MKIDEKAFAIALSRNAGKTYSDSEPAFRDFLTWYESARASGVGEEGAVIEIVPCPYVNGFSSDNSGVSFMLKRYEKYSDFVLFEGGNPARCFRLPNVATLVQESSWQPIETAPRDGTDILVIGKYRHTVVTWAGGKWCNVWTFDGNDLAPTHWMPLPATPAASEKSDG